MGIRGELFSTKVLLQNRTYFFNVKENRLGDLYLNIVESKKKETGGVDRQSVILFADDLTEFLQGFEESLKVLEKANREKKRGAGKPGGETRKSRPRDDDDPRRPQGPWGEGDERPAPRYRKSADSGFGERRSGGRADGGFGERSGGRSGGGFGERRGGKAVRSDTAAYKPREGGASGTGRRGDFKPRSSGYEDRNGGPSRSGGYDKNGGGRSGPGGKGGKRVVVRKK